MSEFASSADATGGFRKHIAGIARRNEETIFGWRVDTYGLDNAEEHRSKRALKYAIPDTSNEHH